MNAKKPVTWKGSQAFRLTASGLHEDTLRIVPNYRGQEMLLQLRLPTLCITYADMRFQNAVGGEQENYPASRAYGPAHFDPPVEITGEADIEVIPNTLEELKVTKRRLLETRYTPIEKAFLQNAMLVAEGNITQAAKNVGMQRSNFSALMKKHDVTPPPDK